MLKAAGASLCRRSQVSERRNEFLESPKHRKSQREVHTLFPVFGIGENARLDALKAPTSADTNCLVDVKNSLQDGFLRDPTLVSHELERRMPAFYKIDRERNLVLTTGYGFVTREEIIALQDRMSNDPEFDPSFSQVADFSQLTNTDIMIADVHTFAQRDGFSINSRRAIIVKGEVAFGFAKIFELCRQLIGATGIRVFCNLDEAFNWILASNPATTSRPTDSARGSLSS